MDGDAKKAAVDAYKKRVAPPGVYAVRCAPTGEIWVGRAADLETIQNRLWFALRTGGCASPALQAAWRAHGEAAFSLAVLEQIDESLPYARDRLLKARVVHWRENLGAKSI